MEEIENIESREAFIARRIEQIAKEEDMNTEDLLSDMMTFYEILKEDEDVMSYFEELAERVGVSVEEIVRHSSKLE